MTPEEFESWEQRNAAIHEAGHAVLWHVLGEQLFLVKIFPNEIPSPDNKTWLGQTQGRIFAERNKILIGLAGEIAEAYKDDPDLTPWEMEDQLELVCRPSESDSRSIGGVSFQDVEQTIALVRDNWEAIQALSDMLLELKTVQWNTVADLTKSPEA